MKILHVIHSVNPRGGGPIEGVRQLAVPLAAQGVATEVLTLDAPGDPGTVDFPWPLTCTGPSSRGYGYNSRVVPWLRQHRGAYGAVVVNGLWQYAGLATWRALHGTATPYYVYPHGMLDPWFKRRYPLKHLKKQLYWPWAEYRVLRDAAAVLFTSEEERLEARHSFSRYSCREEVTGYGITAPPGDPAHQRDLFLRQFPGLVGKRCLLFLGRVHEKKGCDLLLRAWSEVFPAGNRPGTHLVMAGPVDHAYGREMQSLAAQLGLTADVTWTGMLTGDLKWGSLRAADGFVLPSHQENFGISVVEALACGVPAFISNRINIWREIAEDEAGKIENDDLAGTIRLLESWARQAPGEREEMSVKARICFAQRFDIRRTADALLRLLTR